MLDPQQKAYYQQRAKKMKLPNAYTAALTDYMRKPQVKELNHYADVTSYTVSKKDFDIKEVTIELLDANGDAKETRTLHPVNGKAIGFKLTDADRLDGVNVYVSDQAEQVLTWRITAV